MARAVNSDRGIVASYNRLLAGQGAMLFLTPSATEALARHGMEGGYFRSMKRVVSALAGEVVFEERKGTTMVEAADIRRAAANADGDAADLLAKPARIAEPAQEECVADAPPEVGSAGA